MPTHALFRSAALVVTLLVSLTATAAKSVPGRVVSPVFTSAPLCGEAPLFVKENRTEIVGGFAALPKEVLVAREAEMWVEAKEPGALKIHTYQSFMRPGAKREAKVLCASSPENFSDRYSMIAPTLIDLDPKHQVGHSLWQFQVIADQREYSAWNKKSHALARADKLENILKDQNLTFRLYQIGPDEFELLLQKEAAGSVQTLSVKYAKFALVYRKDTGVNPPPSVRRFVTCPW